MLTLRWDPLHVLWRCSLDSLNSHGYIECGHAYHHWPHPTTLLHTGFYVVDRRQGNTGGLGGAFGYFYGTGNPLPIPECQPYQKSKRFRLLNLVGRIGARLKGGK